MSRLALGWGAGQGWPPPCVPLGLSPTSFTAGAAATQDAQTPRPGGEEHTVPMPARDLTPGTHLGAARSSAGVCPLAQRHHIFCPMVQFLNGETEAQRE